MSRQLPPAGDGRSPRAGEVLALLVIVPAVAAAARVYAAGALTTPRWSAVLVGVFAGAVGLPALVWLFERGRTGLEAFVAMGVAAGALPPVLLGISGAVGLALLGGGEYAWWALGHGASIPMYGTLPWPRFLLFLAWSISVGLASGLIFGLLAAPGSRWRRPANWLWAGLVLVCSIAAGLVFG